MARAFAIILAVIFWPILTALILVVGPFIWVYILLRSFSFFSVMMLLHAIANRKLYASAAILEDSITWYPQRLRNSLALLRQLFSSDYDISNNDEEADSDVFRSGGSRGNFFEDLIDSVVRFFWWILSRFIPAIFVWIGIYFLFRSLGIDLLTFVRDEGRLTKLAIWMVGCLLIGLLGIAVMPLVRSLLVTPFVLLMAGIWAVIGLIFWLPRFTFASLDAAASSFLFMMTGGRSRNPVMILTRAFLYYFDGFNIIFSILTNTSIVRTVRSKEEINKEMDQMFRSLGASFLYLLIYLPLWMLLSWPWIPGSTAQ